MTAASRERAAVARRLVANGRTVLSTDVDDVAALVQAPTGLTVRHWEQAHVAHGALVRGWLASDVDVVIAQGPIFTREETDALMAGLPARTATGRVVLLGSVESALQRVRRDPGRGRSADPEFLRATYGRFASLLPRLDPCDLVLDGDREPAERSAARIGDWWVGSG